MIYARYSHYRLFFKTPGGTSRGVLTTKDSWFLRLFKSEKLSGIGECSIIKGLSQDDPEMIESKLRLYCRQIRDNQSFDLPRQGYGKFPSIRFSVEMAQTDARTSDPLICFNTPFIQGRGIPINGLVWMGTKAHMLNQIKQKIQDGYHCLKLKIGAIDFEEELDLIKYIRSEYDENEMVLRVDANGAFLPSEALEKLKRLSDQKIHSLEQPIMSGQWDEMAALCVSSPLDIALDEELIGVYHRQERNKLLDIIRPQYLILKPSLLGGFASCEEWIDLAESYDISWWITSALESNIGLNAIAQWTSTLKNDVYHGLGTGQLFSNNLPSPLHIHQGKLYYDNDKSWDLSLLNFR